MVIHLTKTGGEDERRSAENFYQIVRCCNVISLVLVFSKILPLSPERRDQVLYSTTNFNTTLAPRSTRFSRPLNPYRTNVEKKVSS